MPSICALALLEWDNASHLHAWHAAKEMFVNVVEAFYKAKRTSEIVPLEQSLCICSHIQGVYQMIHK